MTLAGKTILMSGGSRGIGLAIALRAAADGANIAMLAKTDTPHPKLEGTIHTAAEQIRAAGGQALPIVGDVRGDGYFFGIELVKDKSTKETFNDDESERLLRGFLSKALYDAGLYCRADDRGDPVVQLAPPLTIGPDEFVEIRQILESVLTEASNHL